MRAKRMFMATMAAMFVMTGAFQTGSFASNGNGGTRLVAKLAPALPVEDFKGRAVQRVHGIRTVFKAHVEVPLSVLNVPPGDEESISVILNVPRTGMTCTMVFDEVDTIEDVAEYKVFVRKRNTDLLTTNKAGSCTGNISDIIPNDNVVVTIQGVSTPLTGAFSLKH